MPSRSTRRRQHKEQARAAALSHERKIKEAARLLIEWEAEAWRRAGSLSQPAAWALIGPAVEAKARTLDRSGELLAELRRLVAEAIAMESGEPLVGVSRPTADRKRLASPVRDRSKASED